MSKRSNNAARRRILSSGFEKLETRVPQAADLKVGMNLESVVDWSPAWTFTDVFQTSRPWISHAFSTATYAETWEGGGAVNVDAKGWPTQLNQWTNSQGQVMKQRLGTLMFRDIGTAYPAGTYRAEWDGTATLSWGFAAKLVEQRTMTNGKHYALLNVTPSVDGIYLKVADMNAADPLRNLHVWMPDYNGQSFAGKTWSPGASVSPFHPLFLEKLAPFKTLRFMDWQETNASDVATWADRRPYDYATQQSGDIRNGVALEYMIELCNELDDALVEGTEKLTFTLAVDAAYVIDSVKASGTISIADNDVAPRYGLDGAYYDNKDFTAYKFTRLDPQINFNWGTGAPDSRIAKDTFSIRWKGTLAAVEAGNYTLSKIG